jgi:hypothetical protein
MEYIENIIKSVVKEVDISCYFCKKTIKEGEKFLSYNIYDSKNKRIHIDSHLECDDGPPPKPGIIFTR